MKIRPILLLLTFVSIEVYGEPQSKHVQDIDATCEHDSNTFRCVKYLKNYDGDTITVDIPNIHPLIGNKISVRQRGVDCPEKIGKRPCEKIYALAAQQFTENFLKRAKRITLRNVGRDKYFRIVATIEADGESLRDILLKNHLAYEYNGGKKPKVDWCVFTKSEH